MRKKFIIVGSGWRAAFYARIAKALPECFQLCAMLCRSEEKALKVSKELGIHATTSVKECTGYEPDFVVVAVNKDNIFSVTKEWLEKGFVVLCETPAALCLSDLNELWRLHEEGKKLLVAEQYFLYPQYAAIKNVLDSGILGERFYVNASVAHDYHGASIIRGMLGIKHENFTVCGKRFTYPVVETASRYEKFYDGRVAMKNSDKLLFEFESGKSAIYDFNSVQYRSSIRNNYINVQGEKGELKDREFIYLDSEYKPHSDMLKVDKSGVHRAEKNPNLCDVSEIKDIVFRDKCIYKAHFGMCGLSDDETAIGMLMEAAGNYEVLKDIYPLKEALTDSYMSILMKEAIENPMKVIESQKQIWMN